MKIELDKKPEKKCSLCGLSINNDDMYIRKGSVLWHSYCPVDMAQDQKPPTVTVIAEEEPF